MDSENDLQITQTQLKREIRLEVLAILEETAKTEEEFEVIIVEWDSLDANRERRERYHEVKRGDQELPEGYRSKKNFRFLNDIGSNALIRQLQQGDYIDSIFNQPETIHELVTAEYLAKILNNLSDKHKDLLFKLAVGLYSTKELGEERGQSDRNIRKIRATMMKIIHKALSIELYKKKQNEEPMTIYEKKFID